MRRALGVAWYQFRVTLARRWTSYLAVVILIGATGGLAMASVAGARRTQSSYPTFLKSTAPSDLSLTSYDVSGNGSPGLGFERAIAALPDVAHVRYLVSATALPLNRAGAPRFSVLAQVNLGGSTDGLFSAQDRLVATQGHLADPRRLDQIELTAAAARILGVHVGQSFNMGFYKSSTTNSSTPTRLFVQRVTVCAIVVINSQVLQDDIDRAFGFGVVTPALMSKAFRLDPASLRPIYFAIQLRPHHPPISAVEQQLIRVVPHGFVYQFHVDANTITTVELALKPESVALGAFGAIAAMVCLLLAGQALSRQLRRRGRERTLMRSLGASPTATLADALLPAWGSILVGTALAVAVAVALSPLFPLGPVRPIDPDRGLSFDGVVIGLGAAALVVLLCGASLAMAWRAAPQRTPRRLGGERGARSVARAARNSGLPVSAGLGVHFALESGRGRSEVPVRSVLFGSVLAVTLMVTTLTFSSGLHTLISRPALYGWDWSYTLAPTNAAPPKMLALLDHDPLVSAWSGADYTDFEVDGQTVPVIFQTPGARVAPPIISGHTIRNDHQVVLGAATLAALHKRVGDTVYVSYGSKATAPFYFAPRPVTVVGTATFPAIGYSSYISEHTAMGTGALIPTGVQPTAFLQNERSPDPNLNGPELVFVRLRPGVSHAAGLADMERLARVADAVFAADPRAHGNGVSVLGVQRPAQIVNYRSIGSTPELLAAGLALGAVLGLGLTLFASVRRRRRELALLKTLGLSRRQVAATIAWQSSVDGVVGALVGVPLGIVVGRQLWAIFARSINAAPDPTVPVWSVVLVGVGSLVVANLAAALPGRSAARTAPGLALRSE